MMRFQHTVTPQIQEDWVFQKINRDHFVLHWLQTFVLKYSLMMGNPSHIEMEECDDEEEDDEEFDEDLF